MDIRKLAQFLAVVEAQSLSRAAERLHIAQPALTHAIKSLEEDLQVVLFDRHARGMRLTDLGALLAERAHMILHEVERTRDMIKERAANPVGNVRIAFPSIIAGELTTRLVERVHARQANIEMTLVELDAAAAEQAVRTGQCEVAITYCPTAGSDIGIRPILADELAAVLPLSRSDNQQVTGVVDLMSLRLVLLPRGDPLRVALDEVVLRYSARLKIAVEVTSLDDFRPLIEAGYATVLPSSVALRVAPLCNAEVRWLKEPRIPCGLFLITPIDRKLGNAAALVVEELVTTIEDLVNSGAWNGRYIGTWNSSAGTISIVAN